MTRHAHNIEYARHRKVCVLQCNKMVNLVGKFEPFPLHLLAVCLEEAVELGHGGLDLLVRIAEAVLDLHKASSLHCKQDCSQIMQHVCLHSSSQLAYIDIEPAEVKFSVACWRAQMYRRSQAQKAYLDMMLSLLGSKLPVVIHALTLHLEQHGLTDQAAVGFCLLQSCFELNDCVLSFLAVPATREPISCRFL